MTRITEDEEFILNFLQEHADETYDTLSMNKLSTKADYYTLISEYFHELADNERCINKSFNEIQEEMKDAELPAEHKCEYCESIVDSDDELYGVMLSDTTELFVCTDCVNKRKKNNLPPKDTYWWSSKMSTDEVNNKPRKMNCIDVMLQNLLFMMRRCEKSLSQEEVTEAIYLFLDSRL